MYCTNNEGSDGAAAVTAPHIGFAFLILSRTQIILRRELSAPECQAVTAASSAPVSVFPSSLHGPIEVLELGGFGKYKGGIVHPVLRRVS